MFLTRVILTAATLLLALALMGIVSAAIWSGWIQLVEAVVLAVLMAYVIKSMRRRLHRLENGAP